MPFALPSIPGVSSIPGVATAPGPSNPLGSLLQGGFSIPKIGLLALAALPPTGIAGLNLQATGNLFGMLLKVVSYGVGILYALRLNAVYPSVFSKVIMSLMFIGPWYVFDILEYFDPAFERVGFRPPVPIEGYPKPVAPVRADGTWLLTPALISLVMTMLPAYSAGLTSLINFYAPGTVGGNVQQYIGYAAAGVGVLGLAGSLFAATQGTGAPVTTVAPAPLAAPPPLPAAAPPPLPTMAGGALPPLSTFVKDMKRSASPQAFQESTGFLGVLALVIFGGLALGAVRAKQAD